MGIAIQYQIVRASGQGNQSKAGLIKALRLAHVYFVSFIMLSSSRHQSLVFLFIALLHLAAIWLFVHLRHSQSGSPKTSMRLVFIQTQKLALSPRSPREQVQQKQPQDQRTKPVLKPSSPRSDSDAVAVTKPDDALSNDMPAKSPELNRDVGRISQLLERDLRFDEQKLQAAKAPNQIVREYWDKQNRPYKDKWDELAHKIEKAGKPRDLQIETFKAMDGTQISKIDGRCYKAPDPGRTYLHQEEVRQVICPR